MGQSHKLRDEAPGRGPVGCYHRAGQDVGSKQHLLQSRGVTGGFAFPHLYPWWFFFFPSLCPFLFPPFIFPFLLLTQPPFSSCFATFFLSLENNKGRCSISLCPNFLVGLISELLFLRISVLYTHLVLIGRCTAG